ncbi:MAG: hypothetical protein JO166_00790 [Deltaproteobacteria bacterium]|nr:hypothetical protein [Deltaproteobacteria bacterium]
MSRKYIYIRSEPLVIPTWLPRQESRILLYSFAAQMWPVGIDRFNQRDYGLARHPFDLAFGRDWLVDIMEIDELVGRETWTNSPNGL